MPGEHITNLTPEERVEYYRQLAEGETKRANYWHRTYKRWRDFVSRTMARLSQPEEIRKDYNDTVDEDAADNKP